MTLVKNKKTYNIILFLLLTLINFSVVKAENNESNISVLSENSSNRIAPGEFLPISLKLVNFGSEKRIDVVINYKIFNNADKDVFLQKEVYSESETVAVETTASFVKRIQLSYNFKPGLYNLVTVVNYPYQEDPAVSKTPFLVEEKFGGFFKSDLKIYLIFFLITTIAVIIVAVFAVYILTRRKRSHNIVYYDYSDKPKDQIVYYEILSDIVFQMRLRIGDKAIQVAKDTPGLEINEKTGQIINIKQDPAKIISLLIAHYEELTGQPLSFGVARR